MNHIIFSPILFLASGPDYTIFNPLILFSSAMFGLCLGSFYNVCIYRIPRKGMSVLYPKHSFCPHCFTTLRWYENIPVLSYLSQKGQCRHCLVFINPRYPIVEIFTGATFVLFATHFALYPNANWPVFLVYLAFVSALIVCSFIDLDLRIIPDEIDINGMYLAPFISALVPGIHAKLDLLRVKKMLTFFGVDWMAQSPAAVGFVTSLLGILAGAGSIFAIGVLGKVLFRKEAMGFGDVKFLGMIGGFIGFTGVILGLLVACILGAVVGIAVKVITRDSYIPFGPFLALGAVSIILYRGPITKLIFTKYPELLRRIIT